jgi:hypothetical protein
VLTCQDNLSKYIIAVPIEDITAETAARNFVVEIVLKYGIPDKILTDQGTQFMGELFVNCCKLLRIQS